MAWIPRIALAGVFILAAACGAERGEDAEVVLGTASAAPSSLATAVPSEPVADTPGPSDTPSPTPSATAEADRSPTEAADLASRFPAAAALVDESTARVGVAVLTPDAERYVGGSEETFALASVVKLPVMIATLERARIDGRTPTDGERNLMRLMVAVSSNSATDSLWTSLGEGAGVAALLEPLGITDIEFASDSQWGDSRATAFAVGSLLELLIDDESALAPEVRQEALELMQSVVADQRWGASAGVDLSLINDVTLAIKNGWYPEPAGWLLNSAGVITVQGELEQTSAHVVVVLTEGASTQTGGVQAIEAIAAAINHAILPPALTAAVDSPTFTAAELPEDEDEDEPADPELEPTSVPTAAATAAPRTLVKLGQGSDVLVPSNGSLVGSAGSGSDLTLWYELTASAADELLRNYADSMASFGWTSLAGPPSIVLSKSAEGRWVGVSAFPSAPGTRLIEVTISPAPGVLPAGISPR